MPVSIAKMKKAISGNIRATSSFQSLAVYDILYSNDSLYELMI